MNFEKKAIDTAWAEVKPEEIHEDVARVYSEVFTKAELHEIANFYNSPQGQALVAKMPQVQQKIIGLLIPRLRQVVPKIQQMARDFAAERQAQARKVIEDAQAARKDAGQTAGAPGASPAPAAESVPAAPSKP